MSSPVPVPARPTPRRPYGVTLPDLAARRRGVGLSQVNLAARADVSTSAIVRAEAGMRVHPETRDRLEQALTGAGHGGRS